MHSALFFGQLRHRRWVPQTHAFKYPLFMAYLDLAELDAVFAGRWFWSTKRSALACFKRSDYLGDANSSLDQAVRDCVAERIGRRPSGPIRMLTHLRYFGHCFNPVTFYYCFDASGERIETIVTEITNTPWKERHTYVLNSNESRTPDKTHRYRFAKDFHVSPFIPMDIEYDWRFNTPGKHLNVHMEDHRHGEKLFDATLKLQRRPINGWNLAKALIRFPFLTMQVVVGIHWQALRLFLKRTPFHTHPHATQRVHSSSKVVNTL
ncbi:MAG: DUF1365 domain-containing protein [Candidatus Obscuribacterales bacterium]|nr:DUF1365 domain-containing protein [Steroidobacteraceae bacterium]